MPFNNLYNFSAALQELRLRLGNRPVGGDATDAQASVTRYSQWLDSAQARIAGCLIECPDIEVVGFPMTTVEGQSEYGLLEILPPATNIVGIKGFRNNGAADSSDSTDLFKMRRFPWTEFRSLSQQAPGPPMRWARWGYTVAFDPQPDKVYNLLIDYRRLPYQGTTEIPVIFQEDWLHLAESFGWQALMKTDRSQMAMSRISANLQMMLNQELDQQQWESNFDTDQTIAPWGFDSLYTVG